MKDKVECRSCGATGLYCGFAEPRGTAVICLQCNGSGARDADEVPARGAVPFTGRKRREGIHKVSHSRGSFIMNCGAAQGTAMSYEEFQRRFPEGDIWRDQWEK